jgi:hypothetical protein
MPQKCIETLTAVWGAFREWAQCQHGFSDEAQRAILSGLWRMHSFVRKFRIELYDSGHDWTDGAALVRTTYTRVELH